PVAKKPIGLVGIAVDHELGRFYALETCRIKVASGNLTCREQAQSGIYTARNLLAYSITPSGTSLTKVATLPMPEGENELYKPTAIAVDPSNHDVLILAQNVEEHMVVQRVSSAGVLGARFTDTANKLKPAVGGGEASSLAVSNAGEAYTM